MPTLIIRNVPEEIASALARMADAEDRSRESLIRRLLAEHVRREDAMYIKIEFSEDGLFGADPDATAGVDVPASKSAFIEGLTDRLEREYPGADVEVVESLSDRHSVDGRQDTDEAADLGEILHDYWESWSWVVRPEGEQ